MSMSSDGQGGLTAVGSAQQFWLECLLQNEETKAFFFFFPGCIVPLSSSSRGLGFPSLSWLYVW